MDADAARAPGPQVWALQEGDTLHVGGRTTKQKARRACCGGAGSDSRSPLLPAGAQGAFATEMEAVFDELPEYVEE